MTKARPSSEPRLIIEPQEYADLTPPERRRLRQRLRHNLVNLRAARQMLADAAARRAAAEEAA